MLKFFRTIRHRLLANNKIGQYLKYALGEIILVVIGILIALQINNWNEERKNKKTELQMLASIQNNLKEDVQNLSKATERYLLTQKYIIRFFQDLPIPDDSLGYISTRMSGHAQFIPNSTTFSLSINSGKLDLIPDKNLIQQIQQLYALDYLIVLEPHKRLDDLFDRIKILGEKFEVMELKSNERSGDYFDQTYVLPWNIKNLKHRNQSTDLRAMLRHSHLVISSIVRFYNQMSLKNQVLQKNIEAYIKSNHKKN